VTDIFVLDATSASTIASVEGYDALTAGGRKVVVTQQILAEIRDPKTPQIYKDRFNAWYGSNQASIINVTGELNPEDIVVTVTGAITPKLTSPSPCSPHRAARH
jgi:hypothetical protein